MDEVNNHSMMVLRKYLNRLVELEGSDLHIKSGGNVRARVRGEVKVIDDEVILPETMLGLAQELTNARLDLFKKEQEYDTVYVLDEDNRFRVNMYYHLDGIAMVFRLIPHEIKTVEELNLPQELKKLGALNRGLVLVTGTTGSGKSTTLATIIEMINARRKVHIITIEDPVEFAHSDKLAIIEQRGIGQHTRSFKNALRSAMREDPDIIVVGEMRDVETAESVLQAVNTGHLVFSTLHTLDARETIDRLIAIFPDREQNRIRMNLASNLQAVVSQRLIRGKQGGLVPAVEMMFRSPRIEYMIRNMLDNEIPDAMQEERHSFGSVTFNTALFELCLKGMITEEEAYNYATSASDLKLMFTKSAEYNELLKQNGHIDDDLVMIKAGEEEEENDSGEQHG